MAQAQIDDERETGGGFGRFLFFVTPILFTVVLLAVLLSFLNKDVQNVALNLLNKIPVVSSWVPDAHNTPKTAKDAAAKQEKSSEATIKELKKELAEQEAALAAANQKSAEQQQKLSELQSKLDAANTKSEQQAQAVTNEAAEDYQKEVKKLAQLYGDMNAGKAASIMSNLTAEENVLLFNAMSTESKSAILEKMDPKLAADISIKLKDVIDSEDLAIAALQSRLKKESTQGASTAASSSTASGLNTTQLSQTFAAMDAAKAGDLLLQTYKISPEKALGILHAVDDTTRSNILGAMQDKDSATAAKILNKLISK